jgi:hypothetical protein
MGVPSGVYNYFLKYKNNEKIFKDFKLSNAKCLVIGLSTLCMVKLLGFIENKEVPTLVHSFYHGTNVTTYFLLPKFLQKAKLKLKN